MQYVVFRDLRFTYKIRTNTSFPIVNTDSSEKSAEKELTLMKNDRIDSGSIFGSICILHLVFDFLQNASVLH